MSNGERTYLDLCTASGDLDRDAVMWTRQPRHRCNITGHRLRKKRWNYWAIQGPRFVLAVGIANLDYAGTGFVYLVDLHTRTVVETTVLTPFGRGLSMGTTPEAAASLRTHRMTYTEAPHTESTSLLVTCDPFGAGDRLTAAFTVVTEAAQESLGVVVPFVEGGFAYTSKHVALPVVGRVRVGATEIPFEGSEAFATLDFGRGVWPRRSAWNWGAASGWSGPRRVGLNLGGKWTDGSIANENAVFVDGRMTKIEEDLEWTYDDRNFLAPWHMRTKKTAAVDLSFEPVVERKAHTNAVLVRSHVSQVFGFYSGTVRIEDGSTVEIPHLFGWAEEHRALW